MLTFDQYLTPDTLEEALRLWRDAPEGARLIAGATDIVPWAREGRAGDVHLPLLIDVTKIQELSGYTVEGGRVRLGANVVYQDFLTDETLRRLLPCMPFCSIWFADDQIREQATLAGNLVNASPAADGTPAVLVLNGSIELARLEDGVVERRTLPVAEFIQGPGRTLMERGEIVTAVTMDALDGYGGSFEKVGHRRSLVISVACVAAVVKTDASGRNFEDVRLGLGGVGPMAVRLTDIEERLKGQPISSELIREACASAADRVASRSRVAYRRRVVPGFVEAAIEDALAHAGAPYRGEHQREIINV